MLSEAASWARGALSTEVGRGGLAVVLAGSLLYSLRALLGAAWGWAAGRLAVEYEVADTSDAHRWLSAWLARRAGGRRRLSVVSAFASGQGPGLHDLPAGRRASQRASYDLHRVPGFGAHLVRRGASWVLVRRLKDQGGGDLAQLLRRERYVLRAPVWSRGVVEAILREARDEAREADGDGPVMTVSDRYGNWNWVGVLAPRRLDTVVMPRGRRGEVVGALRRFLGSREEYLRRGVPWRFGLLLHGPPGGGKTSLVRALAHELDLDVCYVTLSDHELGDNELTRLMATAARSVVVIEDVDVAFEGRERRQASERISFAGLLNAVDGLMSGDGRVLVMTTNRPEALDPALVRAGRVDLAVEMPPADAWMGAELYRVHFAGAGAREADEFGRAHAGRPMAELHGVLMAMRSVGTATAPIELGSGGPRFTSIEEVGPR